MHGSNTEETTFHRVAAVAAFEVCRMQDVFLLGLFRPSHVTENCKSVCFTAGRDQAYRLSSVQWAGYELKISWIRSSEQDSILSRRAAEVVLGVSP
jgi:hypothetical protein